MRFCYYLHTDYPVYAVFLQQPLVLTVFQWLTSLGEWAVGAFFIVSETSLYITGLTVFHHCRVWMW